LSLYRLAPAKRLRQLLLNLYSLMGRGDDLDKLPIQFPIDERATLAFPVQEVAESFPVLLITLKRTVVNVST
jgi:hypothetical protein